MSVGQVTGLVSGLDTKSLIDAIITAKSRPIFLLQQRQAAKTAELSAWKSFETILVSLKMESDRLADRGLWDRLAVTTTDEDHLSVSAASSATIGTWNLHVESLAVAHQVESQTYASRDTAVGAGTFTITTQDGTTDLTVAAGTTVAQLADLVNDAELGVTATLVRSEAVGVESFSLVLTADESGEVNRFTASAAGLSGGTAPTLTATRTGDDAVLHFGGEGGLELRSSTNVFEDVIDGVDVTVKKAHDTGEATEFSVARDVGGLETAVQQFVERYNVMVDFVNGQFRFDPEVGTRPALLGDSTLSGIAADLRSRVTNPVLGTESATFRTLRAIGLTLDGEGKLSVDSGDFRDALDEDFAAVANLFRANGVSDVVGVEWLAAPPEVDLAGRTLDVQITRAAERATLRGDLFDVSSGVTIDATNDSFRMEIDGTLSEELHLTHGTYASGDALARAIADAIERSDSLGALTVGVSFEPDGVGTGRLVFNSSRWGTKGSLKLQGAGSDFETRLGLTSIRNIRATGVDVAGTVDGIEATGDGRTLTVPSDAEDLAGLSFRVTSEAGDIPVTAGISFTEGLARASGRALTRLTQSGDGTLARLGKSIQSIIDRYASDILAKQEQLEQRRLRLQAQYATLETTLSELTAQSNFVTAQLQAFRGLSSGNS